jgi:hypothetical protein
VVVASSFFLGYVLFRSLLCTLAWRARLFGQVLHPFFPRKTLFGLAWRCDTDASYSMLASSLLSPHIVCISLLQRDKGASTPTVQAVQSLAVAAAFLSFCLCRLPHMHMPPHIHYCTRELCAFPKGNTLTSISQSIISLIRRCWYFHPSIK